MEILSVETKPEADYLMGVLKNSTHLLDGETIFHIGGISFTPKSKKDWYWVNSGKKVGFPMYFAEGQPDYTNGIESCLSFIKFHVDYGFNDIPCFGQWDRKFICQRDEVL